MQASNSNRSVFCSPLWLCGMLCLLSGSVLDITSLAKGNQLLLSCLSSVSILWNTLLSVILLNETLTLKDCFAILIICIGCILFLLLAKNNEVGYSSEELVALYLRPTSLIYLIFTGSFILWIQYFDYKYKKALKQLHPKAAIKVLVQAIQHISYLDEENRWLK